MTRAERADLAASCLDAGMAMTSLYFACKTRVNRFGSEDLSGYTAREIVAECLASAREFTLEEFAKAGSAG